MKSVIAGTTVVTTLTDNNPNNLNRGEIVCFASDGTVVDGTQVYKADTMFQFVVGLGDGHSIAGTWINPRYSKRVFQAYKAPQAKTITFTGITPKVGAYWFNREIWLTLDPNFDNKYNYMNSAYVATIQNYDIDNTATDLLDLLELDVIRMVANFNDKYKDAPVTFTRTGDQFEFVSTVGKDIEVTLQGAVSYTAKTETGDVTSNGTYEEVAEQERIYKVASAGYNPNYRQYEKLYGEIFTAVAGTNYDEWVITSRSPQTHNGDVNSIGMITTQVIAVPTGTSAAALDNIVKAITTAETVPLIPDQMTQVVTP